MPRPNYGPEAKNRTRCLLEALLMYANDELSDFYCPQIRFRWQDEMQLVLETKLRFLEELTAKAFDNGRLNKEQIKEALKRLKDFLEVLEDNRTITQGAEDWHFTLKLWYGQHEKEANLRRFDQEWENRRLKKPYQETDRNKIITQPLIPGGKAVSGARDNSDVREHVFVPKLLELKPDNFDPRTDAIAAANLIIQTFIWDNKDEFVDPQRIAKILRGWSQKYPKFLRVLRRCDNHTAVGVTILYPTASDSEGIFFRPPWKDFYFFSDAAVDPVKMAHPGDMKCTSIYVRFWCIDLMYTSQRYICESLKDAQRSLAEMQSDFPNLCDLYAPILDFRYEEVRVALGFQKINEYQPWYWTHMPLDRYLKLDIEQIFANARISFAPEKI